MTKLHSHPAWAEPHHTEDCTCSMCWVNKCGTFSVKLPDETERAVSETKRLVASQFGFESPQEALAEARAIAEELEKRTGGK